MFTLMLRCGLRVEEVAHLALGDIELNRRMMLIQDGKGAKDRIVYISNDALHALLEYLRVRPASKVKKVFLVEKGSLTGQPISIRGIQKRMEYYAHKTNLRISCHHLRHTMATQMLNADADLSPSRISWGTILSERPSGTVGYQILKYRGITTKLWR